MAVHRRKWFIIAGLACSFAFLTLFAMRLGLFDRLVTDRRMAQAAATDRRPSKDTWMRIYQNERPIGYAHRHFDGGDTGFLVTETVFMRINTMGLVQDIRLQTEGRLNPDYTMAAFESTISSGRFSFQARGHVVGDDLEVETIAEGFSRRSKINLLNKPYMVAGIVDAVQAIGLKPNEQLTFDIFDPLSMQQSPVRVSLVGPDPVTLAGKTLPATKMQLEFKGTLQYAWFGETGEILKEKGFLGIRLEKATKSEALAAIDPGGGSDIAELASVTAEGRIENLATLDKLMVRISGVDTSRLHLNGERQLYKDGILTIRREKLTDLPPGELGHLEQVFLNPTPFIESDHPKIQRLARRLSEESDGSLLGKAENLINWVYTNIEKRPVISLPDALSTLENRVGDCNEHAVLVAALARAAGIPARIETGVVYLDGRFYYHAWNLLYLGSWVTADAVFGQLPADVSHIRLATGAQDQFDLMGVIGRLQIKVL